MDKNSVVFRYPVNIIKKASFKADDRVDVIGVNELLNRSMLLFVHTSDVFARYTDYADEIENYYKGLMQDQYEQNIPISRWKTNLEH